MSVARRLAEFTPETDIVILETMQIGQGPSGKNSGYMLDLHSHGEVVDAEELERKIWLWENGLNNMRKWVRDGQIQCQWSEWGRLYGAAGDDGERNLEKLVVTLVRLGRDYSHRDASRMRKDLATDFYYKGIHVPGNAVCNPAALMCGFKRTLPANVDVYENTPVVSLNKRDGGYTITTSEGTIQADKVAVTAGPLLK